MRKHSCARTFSLLLYLLCGFSWLSAHDSDHIRYRFWQEGQAGTLTIYLTPERAIDLVQHLMPDLQQQHVIRIGDYLQELTQYFNQSIDLQIQDRNIRLGLLNADFLSHEATMEFRLENFPGSFDNYHLELSSFTEVYQHLNNHVSLELPSGTQDCVLDAKEMICASETSMMAGDLHLSAPVSVVGYFRLSGMMFLILGIFFFWREIKANS